MRRCGRFSRQLKAKIIALASHYSICGEHGPLGNYSPVSPPATLSGTRAGNTSQPGSNRGEHTAIITQSAVIGKSSTTCRPLAESHKSIGRRSSFPDEVGCRCASRWRHHAWRARGANFRQPGSLNDGPLLFPC